MATVTKNTIPTNVLHSKTNLTHLLHHNPWKQTNSRHSNPLECTSLLKPKKIWRFFIWWHIIIIFFFFFVQSRFLMVKRLHKLMIKTTSLSSSSRLQLLQNSPYMHISAHILSRAARVRECILTITIRITTKEEESNWHPCADDKKHSSIEWHDCKHDHVAQANLHPVQKRLQDVDEYTGTSEGNNISKERRLVWGAIRSGSSFVGLLCHLHKHILLRSQPFVEDACYETCHKGQAIPLPCCHVPTVEQKRHLCPPVECHMHHLDQCLLSLPQNSLKFAQHPLFLDDDDDDESHTRGCCEITPGDSHTL